MVGNILQKRASNKQKIEHYKSKLRDEFWDRKNDLAKF